MRLSDIQQIADKEKRKEALAKFMTTDHCIRYGFSSARICDYSEQKNYGVSPEPTATIDNVQTENIADKIGTISEPVDVVVSDPRLRTTKVDLATGRALKAKSRKIMFTETYLLPSFYDDYGVGKTVKTFTLLPNEKTKIGIKTWKTTKQTQSKRVQFLILGLRIKMIH